METNFQTSFIPKKPLITEERSHPHAKTSILLVIGVFLFILSISSAVFVFGAKSVLLRSQEQLKSDLAANEKRFNLPLIEELKKANVKIDLANQLLKNHLAVSEVFAIISGLTIDGVHFSALEFTAGDSTGGSPSSLKVNMKGVANNYNSVAFQSDVFGRSQKYGTNKVIKNPILSDLSVDPNGNVLFNFSAEFSLPDITYEKALTESMQAAGLPAGELPADTGGSGKALPGSTVP